MSVTERIYDQVQKLPGPFQVQVLDFAEYLLAKVERETAPKMNVPGQMCLWRWRCEASKMRICLTTLPQI